MPDELNQADILGTLTQNTIQNSANELSALKSIDGKLSSLIQLTNSISMSDARSRVSGSQPFKDTPHKDRYFGGQNSVRGSMRSFTKEFEDALFEEFLGTGFKKSLNEIRDQFLKDLGISMDELPQTLGKLAAKQLGQSIKSTKIGKSLTDKLQGKMQGALSDMTKRYSQSIGQYMRSSGGTPGFKYGASGSGPAPTSGGSMMPDIGSMLNSSMGGLSGEASQLSESMGLITEGSIGLEGGLAGLEAAIGTAAPAVLLIAILLKETLGPAIQGISEWTKAVQKASNRTLESAKKNIDESQKRLQADVETLVRQPFDILNAAAQKWYDTWDSNLRTINATQGYNKTQLQELISSFSDRLRSEDLTAVVSAADITDNLAKVLDSGLSGKLAEEFAYIATILNAAVPTQDFFGYADTYASIAANAVALGKSQEESLAVADAELMNFANNLLYASREISGGFSTGLKDGAEIFKKSAQIAQASRTYNASEISQVFAAVASITGAIAPDLASSMTDLIYNAAVGGNDSKLVALRSLAGINASNTEFLRSFASNPKQVLMNLFNALADRQEMSTDAYMEVAEGLSDVFGVSAEAFSRVDFRYLGKAIFAFRNAQDELGDNLALLRSGETTTTAEQLKMQQINQQILDEGLSYVLDNEAARAIQQHMWDEQIARQLMETEYGVELEGASLKAMTSIAETTDKILKVVNPVYGLGKAIANLSSARKSSDDVEDLEDDIREMLKLGVVSNRAKSIGPAGLTLSYRSDLLNNLTTRGKDLNIIPSLVNLMGGSSNYVSGGYGDDFGDIIPGVVGNRFSLKYLDPIMYGQAGFSDKAYSDFVSGVTGAGYYINSRYDWGTIGKSTSAMISAMNSNAGGSIGSGSPIVAMTNAIEKQTISMEAQERANQKVQSMLDGMRDYFEEDTSRTYEDWLSTAYKYGIADVSTALANAGYDEEAVQGQWEAFQTQAGAKQKADREAKEEQYWIDNIALLTESIYWLDHIDSSNERLVQLFEGFINDWQDYYLKHTVYNSAYDPSYVDKVLRTERENSETAIYALADALTENDVKLLLDPTVQTNALLAQILKVASAILNQGNSGVGGVSLPDTIAGLSLGIVK